MAPTGPEGQFRFFKIQLSTEFESLFLVNTRKERKRKFSHSTTKFKDVERRLIVLSKTRDIEASFTVLSPPTSL